MKVNLKKLYLKKTPEYVTDTEVVELQAETNLEKTWNYLAKYYTSLEEEKEISQLKKLFENFYFAGLEIETCKNAFDLINQNIVKAVKIKKTEEINDSTLKTKVLNDLIEITKRKKKLLVESMNKENSIYDLVQFENVYIENNRLKIWIDLRHKLDCTSGKIKKPEKWTSLGLHCTIKYKGIKFEGFYKQENLDTVADVKEYIKEINIEKKYSFGGFSIAITRGNAKKCLTENEFCGFVIEAMKNEVKNDKLQEMMVCYTSKYIISAFLRAKSIQNYKIISLQNNLLLDQLSTTYFCACDEGIIKVIRENGDILLFWNEKQVKYF